MAQNVDLICAFRDGCESHLALTDARIYLAHAAEVFGYVHDVDGTEGFTDTAKELSVSLGRGLLNVSMWVSDKALMGLKKGFTEVNKQLNFCFSSNQSLIRKVSNGVGSSKEDKELSLTADLVASLTSEGQLDTIEHDYKELAETCVLIKKHVDELNAFLEKSLGVIKRLNSVKDERGAVEVYEAFVGLKYPELAFANHEGNGVSKTPVLPNGKVIEVAYKDNGKTILYSMSGSKPSGTAGTLNMGKAEIKAFVDKLNPLNELHKTLITANQRYLKFSADWSAAVKSAYEHLENVNSISSTIHKDLETILRGNANCLAFYSGFTPRLSTYVNKYIHDVLNLASKLI